MAKRMKIKMLFSRYFRFLGVIKALDVNPRLLSLIFVRF